MKTTIIFIFLMLSVHLYSEDICTEYRYEIPNEPYVFSILLYENATYDFILTHFMTHDTSLNFSISQGMYKLVGSNIVLTDTLHKFEMLFVYCKNNILAKKTFYRLQDKEFVYRRKNSQEKFIIYVPPKAISPLTDTKTDKISLGSYIFEYIVQKNCLNILDSNNFNYNFNNFTLLYGTYTQKQNQLLLYDFSLKHTFIFYIENKKIIENFLIPSYKLTLYD